MDFISFKVIEGSEKAKEVEEWNDSIDKNLAVVDIEYLPADTTPYQEMFPIMKLTMLGGYKPRWYKEWEFNKILLKYVKVNRGKK